MPDTENAAIPVIAWALLLLLGLIWGGSFVFAHIAVQFIPPMTLAFLRLFLAAIAIHLYLRGRDNFYGLLKARWRSFLLLGLLNNAIPHTLLFYGQTEIGAGLASILNASTPVWTIIIAHFLTRDEKMNGAKLAGVALGILGTIVLVAPGITMKSEVPAWALLLPILAAVSYGFAAIFGRSFRGLPAPAITAGQLTASSMIMLPACLAVDHPWSLGMPPVNVILAVLALALLATAFAYILFFRIIALAGATNVSLVTLLVPASAILLGTLFLGERLGLMEFAGLALIATGLVAIDGRLFRLWKRRKLVFRPKA